MNTDMLGKFVCFRYVDNERVLEMKGTVRAVYVGIAYHVYLLVAVKDGKTKFFEVEARNCWQE